VNTKINGKIKKLYQEISGIFGKDAYKLHPETAISINAERQT
jgi:hypothetical protein